MDKKGFEMTISTVIVLVLGLILLGVGIYIITTKIIQPSNAASSVFTCEARGGQVVSGKADCPDGIYVTLPSDDAPPDKKGQLLPCCIKSS